MFTFEVYRYDQKRFVIEIFFMRSSFMAQMMDFGRCGRINSATHHAVETHVKH